MTGLELIFPVVQGVLSNYISGRLTNRCDVRNRAELIGQVGQLIKTNHKLESKIDAMEIAVRELDILVRMNRDLVWKNDELEIRPTSRIRTKLPSPEEAILRLKQSVAARRAELGLPLKPEQPPAAEGDLTPPPDTSIVPPIDWQQRLAALPMDVLREKERRAREAGE